MVHFEINFWYVSAYLKGIQDVGVFVTTVFSTLGSPKKAATEKSKLNTI